MHFINDAQGIKMTEKTNGDSFFLCASDLGHAAIFDNYTELRECTNSVVKRITALAAASVVPASGLEILVAAALQVIEMNRQEAKDRLGHAAAAETWSCVKVLREALAAAAVVPAPVASGSWDHLKLMMEHSAWDGALQLTDALANIDDFATTPPQTAPVAQLSEPTRPTNCGSGYCSCIECPFAAAPTTPKEK